MANSSVLMVEDDIEMDNSISMYEVHSHLPYAPHTFNISDEIIIPINQQDIFTLPSKSTLYIEGKVTAKKAATDNVVAVQLVNNAIAFLFEEIRYNLGGIEVDRNRNVGITSTLKNLLSMRSDDQNRWENACFSGEATNVEADGTFSFCVPLKMLLGFMEDYDKIILNVRQELVLLRSSTNANAVLAAEANARVTLTLSKIQWRMPYIHVEDVPRLKLLKTIDSDRVITMPFRSWELYEYPTLPQTNHHSWTVKTASRGDTPRYVVLALQTNRKNSVGKNNAEFDLCGLQNVRLYLNAQQYPYENLHGNKHLMYDMFQNFQHVYYGREDFHTGVSFERFKNNAPLLFIDCSRQKEVLKGGSVDVRIEIETGVGIIPADTTAYCLIIYDTVMGYKPLSGEVKHIL
jgi:hypothetical protein